MLKRLLPKNSDQCPYLFLAPMEGVGDRAFRRAITSIGGFDEASTEFIRVPANGHIPSLIKHYNPLDTFPIPQAAQIMGSNPELMAEMTQAIANKLAPRIDLNCGCPSNTVTGKGAGSSLLKDPEDLYRVAKAMVDAVEIPVTAKLRSGFNDTALFKENLLAAESSGVRFITLHPRTKAEGYTPPANWKLIAQAKDILSIPVVGNGDILNVQDALNMLSLTNCDALMIGRGCVINPFIFQEIKAHFAGVSFKKTWKDFLRYIEIFTRELSVEMTEKGQVSKVKQLMSFLFKGNPSLLEHRVSILRADYKTVSCYLDFALPLYKNACYWDDVVV